ncbi:EamA family transporter [Candidatus Daviesbacteria bacterium]|nr:EamA family transporter [Candidatus Daviesbacteria bacterium]
MWFWLALGSAILGAIEVILSKKALEKVSPALLSWSFFALTLPILISLTLLQGIPSFNLTFVLGVAGSSLFFVVARTIFNDAIKNNLISQILPLTAFSGIFTYIFGIAMLSETLRLIPVVGLFTVIIGSYILNVDQAKEDIFKPFKLLFKTKGSLLFLLAIFFGSITAILDKIGVQNTFPQNPTFTVFSEQLLQSALMTMYLFRSERKTWLPALRQNFNLLFLMSLIFLLVSLLIFYAYINGGPVALVLGVKRLQIFFILILGYIFLKDKPTKQSWIATTVMVLGVLLIKLG